jgi:hypothetical protein
VILQRNHIVIEMFFIPYKRVAFLSRFLHVYVIERVMHDGQIVIRIQPSHYQHPTRYTVQTMERNQLYILGFLNETIQNKFRISKNKTDQLCGLPVKERDSLLLVKLAYLRFSLNAKIEINCPISRSRPTALMR